MSSEHRMPSRHGGKIGRQIVLPLSKATEIAWKSIRIRLWRSLITTSGIILAIAFLTSVWTSGAISSALQRVPEDDPRYLLVQHALQQQAIAVDKTSIRVGVIGGALAGPGSDRSTPNILIRDALQEREEFSPFLAPAQPDVFAQAIRDERGEDRPDAFVITSFPKTLATADTVAALGQFVEGGGTLIVFGLEQLLPEGTDPAVRAALEGLLPGSAQGRQVQVAGDAIDPSAHAAAVGVKWTEHPSVSYLSVQPGPDAEMLASASGEGIVWISTRGSGTVVWYPVAGGQVAQAQTLGWFLKGRLLANSLRWGARAKFTGGTAAKRNLWLVSLSLLVCIVGITNAMLMSVTERFREIGTMKCLGALDSFVVRLFLIESSFQGAGGSLIGAALGFLLAFGRAAFTYHVVDPTSGVGHWLSLGYFPALAILFWLAVAVAAGTVLSVIAAVYPAYSAARMQPVEAMRSEA